MHNYIFEVSGSPVSQSKLTAESVPSWFMEERADWLSDVDEPGRNEAIRNFVKCFGSSCERQGDAFQFGPRAKQEYFEKAFNQFHSSAEKLCDVGIREFCGDGDYRSCSDLVYRLQTMFNEQDATYIYLREDEEIITMDEWVRSTDFSLPFCIGGVVDYHC